MSDLPQGPGWWRASDGLYYPPEAQPAGGDAPGEPLDPQGQETGSPATDDSGDSGDSLEPGPDRPGDPSDAPVDPTVVDGPPAVPVDPDRTGWSESWGTDRGIPGDGVAAAGVAGAGVPGEPGDPGDPGDGFDDGEPPRRRWLLPVIALVVIAAIAAGIVVWLLLDQDDDESADTNGDPDTVEPADTDEPTDTTEDDATTTTEDDSEVSVYELGVGDCFDTIEVEEGDGLLVTTVELVECDDPHQAEVFSIETLENPSGDPFPGAEERDAAAQGLCEPGFEEFVGVPLAESELLLLWLAPTDESWADDDREVACVVAAPDGETLTGTSADAAR